MTYSKKKKFKVKHLLLFLSLFIVTTLIVDLVRISKYEVIPMKPAENLGGDHDRVQFELANDSIISDWNRLDGTLKYIQETGLAVQDLLSAD